METQQYCNGLLLVPKTMSLHRNYLLSSVVTDIQDGNGLKHEKISQFFQVLKLCLEKNCKTLVLAYKRF